MRFVWPWDEARVVDDDELERLYSYPADPRWLAVNYVSSADGAVEVGGRAARLSNAPDRKVLQLGSDLADVLLVGAATAMIEDFEGVHPSEETLRRRRRHGLADIPPTAVVTTGRTLPADAPVITKADVPTIVITCESASAEKREAWADAGAEVLVVGTDTVDVAAAVQALVDRGLGRIDCEGGPHLFGSLIEAGVVDELRLTVSPLLVSGPAGRIATGVPIDPVDLDLVSVLAEGGVMLLRYRVRP
ncbi:pyrimidine reductase family protein [Gandjariella thermophila]|uniref:5-amino-6-(5-phosphoribosylamino)uracil reductase n=1 Tax=Gandjariella thermophila TaxID=1931992 RepID=A0A4D4JCS7_9PSEU|nr:pyrimidine reductase family protein [Gandjariella thermophila]GDY33434.1 5-amino-6-(5-phosphoribosylamino)uracil reductase [Gandjariella thermophila]